MKKYEYKTIGHTLFDWGGIIGILNREGEEGWQVVHRGPDTFLLMRDKAWNCGADDPDPDYTGRNVV